MYNAMQGNISQQINVRIDFNKNVRLDFNHSLSLSLLPHAEPKAVD